MSSGNLFGTAFLEIKTKFDKRQMAGVQQQMQGTISGLAGQVGMGVFGGMGAMAIVNNLRKVASAASRAGVSILKAGMDAFEAENLFTVSMENMAGAARKWSESYAKSLRLSAFEVRQLLGNMQLMLVGLGHSTDAALPFSKAMVKLAIDMASLKNVPVQEAFQKIQAGIAGVIRPLRKWGFALSAAEVKQVAFATGITKMGKEMTEQEKQLSRMILLLHKTRQVHGDMARTMNSAANMWRALTTAIEDSKKTAGFGALPGLEQLLRVLVELTETGTPFRGAMNNVGQTLGSLARDAAGGVSAFARGLDRAKDTPGIVRAGVAAAEVGGSLLNTVISKTLPDLAKYPVRQLAKYVEAFGVKGSRAKVETLWSDQSFSGGLSRDQWLAKNTQQLERMAGGGRAKSEMERKVAAQKQARDEFNLRNTTMLGGGASMGFGAMGGLGVGSAELPMGEEAGAQQIAFSKEMVTELSNLLTGLTFTTKDAKEE